MIALLVSLTLTVPPPDPLIPGSPSMLRGHTDAIVSLAFSPDGKMVASGSRDKTVRLWNLESGAVVSTISGAKQQPAALAFSPDNKLLAIGDSELEVRLVDVSTGQLVRSWLHPDQLAQVLFSPDGTRLVVIGFNGNCTTYSVKDGKKVFDFRANGLVMLNAREGLALTVDQTLRPVDLRTGKLKKAIAAGVSLSEIRASSDGSTLVGFSRKGPPDVSVIDRKTGKELSVLKGPRPDPSQMPENRSPTELMGMAISANGKRLVTTSLEKAVRVWDADPARLVTTFITQQQAVVAISPDGTWVAASDVGAVKLFHLEP